MTRDLGLLVLLLLLAVWLAAHNREIGDNDPIIWDARALPSDGDD